MEKPEQPPKKNGSRAGRRSVSHLSRTQLQRKRENDREAQRNIRQRNKQHMECLEKMVKELQEGMHTERLGRMKLEAENKQLKAQLAQRTSPEAQDLSTMPVPLIPQKLMPQKFTPDWVDVPYKPEDSVPVLALFPDTDHIYTSTLAYDEPETSLELYTIGTTVAPTAAPIWDDPPAFSQVSQSLIKPSTAAWVPFQAPLSRLSQYGYSSDIPTTPTFVNTTSWQSQPAPFGWQSATKLKMPVTHLDCLVMSVIESQLLLSADSGRQALDPGLPPVEALFSPPNPAKPPSTINKIMGHYAAVLVNRGFALVPELLASFVAMYRFVQWQISPTYANYKALFTWQRPQPSQLNIAHPAWMDFPPWPEFRDMIIQNQDRYNKMEFQNDYVTNLNINFPYEVTRTTVCVNGQMKVSEVLERHMRDISHATMKKPFADKYPEFRDICRFEDS